MARTRTFATLKATGERRNARTHSGWSENGPFTRARSRSPKAVLSAIRATGGSGPDGAIKGLSHITGGGLSENIPRVMPAGLAAHIDLATFKAPAVFGWLQRAANLDDVEMLRTFNCGIGVILIADQVRAGSVLAALTSAGEKPVVLGAVEAGRGVKSSAKGKGEAEAVRYSAQLSFG